MLSVVSPTEQFEKCGMDHILDAQSKGEINEDNVLYIVENINVAGMSANLWAGVVKSSSSNVFCVTIFLL
jgi:trans-cinnamate 4-monooxygenase